MDIAERILTEYRELPGLKLTTRQAARLWAIAHVDCERLLNRLVTDGHLCVDATGQYASSRHLLHASHSRDRATDRAGRTVARALARALIR